MAAKLRNVVVPVQTGEDLPAALLVAFQFPPFNESSGHQRVVSFARYLPAHGWRPLVLTAHPRAYDWLNDEQMADIPEQLVVKRAFALDARKHLSIRKAYPQLVAIPDRWSSWLLGAVPAGLAMVRRYRPKVIWATYPFASALLVGLTLHRLTGLPLIADLRDPIESAVRATSGLNGRAWRWLERNITQSATRLVFTTPGAARSCAVQHGELPETRCTVIQNGYDERDFEGIETKPRAAGDGPLVLLHSGILYKDGRDPRPLLAAIARLQRAGFFDRYKLQIVFRGCGDETYFRGLIAAADVGGIVRVEPRLGYRAALREMCEVDGLLIIQGTRYNNQIPAKLYEYMRAARPILALTDESGNTSGALRAAGIDTLAPAADEPAIATALAGFVEKLENGTAPIVRPALARQYSREARTAELARIFDQATAADGAWCRAAR